MTNIIKEDNKLVVQKIKECTCKEKNEENYILLCTIKEKGTRFYSYKRDQDYISEESQSNKLLYLSADAKKSINDVINEFDKELVKFSNNNLDYLHLCGNCYSLLIRKNGKIKIYPFCNANELAHNVWCYYDGYDDNKKSILHLAIQKNDHLLTLRLKAYYNEASIDEINELEKLLHKKVLCNLSNEYDKCYSVVASTIDFKILTDSGYKMLHRPYFSLKDSTHNNFSLNPHTKVCVDAAKSTEKSITFDEYLDLFN